MDRMGEIALTCIGAFMTAGLIFAFIRRRQTGVSYILFWRNPLGARTREFLSHGFFHGTFSEVVRIAFFAMFTLLSALAIFQ